MTQNMNTYRDILKSFDLSNIPDLDVAVLGALELFQEVILPTIDTSAFKHPLVVGSGNAEATGRILFQNNDALFASESTFEEKLKTVPGIDSVVLLSASGGKHSPRIAKIAKKFGKKVILLTNTPHSPASRELDSSTDTEYLFPKNREPYTYNTSTYMGIILGVTHEDPTEIMQFLLQNQSILSRNDIASFDKFFLIVPPRFSGIIRMLQVKFIELFGRMIARDVETSEYMAHAVTVVPSRELFISFGDANTTWGTEGNRWNVPLPKHANYATMMAVGYYIIAQIQKQHPPYFKENISLYTKNASVIFGQEIKPIVE